MADPSVLRISGRIWTRPELEELWDSHDRSYLLAWVQQTLLISKNKTNDEFNPERTEFYEQMLFYGKLLENVEAKLTALGWVRPPPRAVVDLF